VLGAAGAEVRMRHEPWLRTYTGRSVHILNPSPEEIHIQDIAHALSHTCRFGGHTPAFHSVAHHSVLVSELLEPTLALWGLLHDASEAYLHDITRPLKSALPNYDSLETRMMAAICNRFGLPPEMPPPVKVADNIVLATEFRDLFDEPISNCSLWAGAEPMQRLITPLSPEAARKLFLLRFEGLTRRVA
jgi:hypothetical protein